MENQNLVENAQRWLGEDDVDYLRSPDRDLIVAKLREYSNGTFGYEIELNYTRKEFIKSKEYIADFDAVRGLIEKIAEISDINI